MKIVLFLGKLALKLALLLVLLLICAIIGWGLHIHYTTPELPSFETFKNELQEKQDSAYPWVSFDELPQELVLFTVGTDPSVWEQASWLDVAQSRICLQLWMKKGTYKNIRIPLKYDSTTPFLIDYIYWDKNITPKNKIKNLFYHCAHVADLNHQWSKPQQVETYLNSVYFELPSQPNGIYAAANIYFNKQPKNLTVSESAIIHALRFIPTLKKGSAEKLEQAACLLLKEYSIPQAEQLCSHLPKLAEEAIKRRNDYIDNILKPNANEP